MNKLYELAKGYTNRFPNENTSYQIVARILEECGEVTSEVKHFENSGIKTRRALQKTASRRNKTSYKCFNLAAVYYKVEDELKISINRSIDKIKNEGLL